MKVHFYSSLSTFSSAKNQYHSQCPLFTMKVHSHSSMSTFKPWISSFTPQCPLFYLRMSSFIHQCPLFQSWKSSFTTQYPFLSTNVQFYFLISALSSIITYFFQLIPALFKFKCLSNITKTRNKDFSLFRVHIFL